MTEENKYFDEDLDFGVPSRLSNDLKAIFEPQIGVPPEVDRAVMDRINKHFTAVQSGKPIRLRVHWAWRIAAAAAVIIFAFSLDLTKQIGPTTDHLPLVRAVREPPLQPSAGISILIRLSQAMRRLRRLWLDYELRQVTRIRGRELP